MINELIKQGLITEGQKDDIVKYQLKNGCSLEDAVIKLNLIDPDKLSDVTNLITSKGAIVDFYSFMFGSGLKTGIVLLSTLVASVFSFPIIFSTYIGLVASQFIYGDSNDSIIQLSYYTMCVASVAIIIKYFLGVTYYKSINKFCQMLAFRLFKSTVNTSYVCFNQLDKPQFISVFTEHIENISRSLKVTAPYLLESLLTIVVIVAYMVYIDVAIVLVIIPLVAIILYLPQTVSKKAPKHIEDESNNIAYLNRYLEDLVQNKNLIVTQGITSFHKHFQAMLDSHYINQSCKWVYWNLSFNIRVTFVALVSMLSILVGGHRILNGSLMVSEFISFYFLLVTLVPKLDQIFRTFINVQTMAVSYRKILDASLVPSQTYVKNSREIPRVASVELNDVSYSVGEMFITPNMNYTFYKGNTYVIHGESGIGKTTLLKLISNLIHPKYGNVIYRDVAGNEIDFNNSMVSYMYQDSMPFIGKSITKNIILDKEFDSYKLQSSINKACLNDALVRVKDINKETLGNGEGSICFSGGQYQRLELARLIYRDSPIVLLDEPTSSLDTKLRKNVYSNILIPENDKIKIVISHDLVEEGFRMDGLHFLKLSKNSFVEL